MKCSICNQLFSTIDILYTHLRNAHLLSLNTVINCGEENCPSSFSNLKSYRGHLVKKHRELEIFTTEYHLSKEFENNQRVILNSETLLSHSSLNQATPTSNNVTLDDTFESEGIPSTHDETHVPPEEEIQNFDIGWFRNEIEKQAAKILCNLYGNVNLTSSVINEIVNNFSTMLNNVKNIITPKVCSVVPVNYKNDTETLLDISFSPFASLKTEYIFRNHLTTNGCFAPPTKFTLEKKIGSKVRNGIPQLSVTTKTGTLMPIEFQYSSFLKKIIF